MSKLLKSKFLLGVFAMVVLFAIAGSAFAADGSITKTLKKGMKDIQVKYLQQNLNEKGFTVSTSGVGSAGMENTSFGSKTLAAVKSFQTANQLTADGVFGPMSRAALAVSAPVASTFPAGCTSATGFSTTTGASCATGTVTTTNLPDGCTSAVGYSPTTGVSCATGTTTTTTTSGPLSVALASDNPASGTIVAGQATADLAHFTFTGTGTLNSVTLQRTGVYDQNTLTNVYLYDGMTRLTDGYSFNTAGLIVINNLNLAISGSKTLSVKADVYSSTSSYNIIVSLVGFTAGTTASTVNLVGNNMFVATGTSLASVSVNAANSVAAATVNAGTMSYAVWRQAVQVNTRTMQLKAANFRVTGSAPADALANVSLYIDGVKTGSNATTTMTNGSNYLTFDMSAAPVTLTTGSHTIEVRGDVVKGSNYDLTVALQQASDLMVFDSQVGVNVAITATGAGSIPSTAGKISIGQGSATIVIDPAFSSMTNITGGSSNTNIAKFKVHGYGEDVKVTSITVTPVLVNACTSGSTYNTAPCNVTTAGPTHTQFATGNGLQNVTLYFNGSQVGSQQSWGSGALTFSLGSQMIIPAGIDSTLEVRADLLTSPASSGANDSTATSGVAYTSGTVSANLGTGTAEGFTSHASITTAAQTGNTLSIQTGLLAAAKNVGYANTTLSPNSANTKIGSFVLQNQSSSESVRVTSLTVGMVYDSNSDAAITSADTAMTSSSVPALTNFSGLKTSETTGSGSVPVQPQGSNVFSVDFTLAPGASKTVDIFADTSSTTGSIFGVTLAASALGSSSNTSISVAAVVGQKISLGTGTVASPVLVSASSTAAQYVPAGDPLSTGTGATDATKADYTFVSTNGSATINELKFGVSGTGNQITSVKIGNVSAPVFAGIAWLQGLNLAVPNGGSGLTISVYSSYAPVGTSGITPGTTSTLSLTYMKYVSGTTTTIKTISGTANGTVYFDTDSSGTVTTGDVRNTAQDSYAVAYTGSTSTPGTAVLTAFSTGSATASPLFTYTSATTTWAYTSGEAGWTVTSAPAATSFTAVHTDGRTITATGITATNAQTFVVVCTRSVGGYAAGSTVATGNTDLDSVLPSTLGVVAPTMTMVGSRPAVSIVSARQAGLNTSGSGSIGQVTVAADAKGNIKLDRIIFTVAGSGFSTNPTSVTGASLVDESGVTIGTATCTPISLVVTCNFGTASTSDYDGYTITAGTTKTFTLKGTLAGHTNGTGTLTVSGSILAPSTDFIWDDTSTNGFGGSTALTGTLIYNFPTSPFTIGL